MIKNEIDYIYEFSDLNLFQTRVEIFTGKYLGIIVEFGDSGVFSGVGKPQFNFDYTIYKAPKFFEPNAKFEEYLTNLLISIIEVRNADPLWKEKLDNATGDLGAVISKIKIDSKWYPNQYRLQDPVVVQMQEF